MAESATATLATALAVLSYACWPFIKLFQAVALLLRPFWTAARFVLLPVTYLVHGILSIALLPTRLQLLERLETIYIYVGIAGLIGCLAGAVLHLSFNFLTTAFRIDSVAEAKARERGRSAAQHRAQRQRKRALESPDLPSTPTLVKKEHASRRQRGLLSQTIIEEEDSDF